MTVISRST